MAPLRPEDAVAANLPKGQGVRADLMMVSALREDGGVNLDTGTGGEPIPAACNNSYYPRAVGDMVMVLITPFGYRVMDKVGPGGTQAPVTWADVQGKPAAVSSVPDPVTIQPQAAVLYQSGHRSTAINGGRPVQGSYGSYPANSGGWFYGTDVQTACAGKTVAGMFLRLSRISTPHGATYGNVTVHLFLIDAGTPPTGTPSMHDAWNGPAGFNGLQLGEVTAGKGIALAANYVTALSTGASMAIGVSSGQGRDLIEYGNCGQLTATFSA